jgi:hypothetical protein
MDAAPRIERHPLWAPEKALGLAYVWQPAPGVVG